jgi:hypothetical protein
MTLEGSNAHFIFLCLVFVPSGFLIGGVGGGLAFGWAKNITAGIILSLVGTIIALVPALCLGFPDIWGGFLR